MRSRRLDHIEPGVTRERRSLLQSRGVRGQAAVWFAGVQCCGGEMMELAVRSPAQGGAGVGESEDGLERAEDGVRSSAESSLFCVSRSVTSGMGGRTLGRGTPSVSLSLSMLHLSQSTIPPRLGSLLILPTPASAPLSPFVCLCSRLPFFLSSILSFSTCQSCNK